jgi:hypothetical protein
MLLLGVVQAQAAGDVSFGSYDLLATEILTSSAASVTFSSLGDYAADYQHLQLRYTVRHADSTAGVPDLLVRLNGDTGSNYSWHMLFGNGSSVSSFAATSTSSMRIGATPKNSETLGAFEAGVTDILDPFETTKYTTIRPLSGRAQTTNFIGLFSGSWRNVNSLTSITLLPDSSNLITGSRFSLYGIKAV